MKLLYTKLSPLASTPTQADLWSAGYDLTSIESYTLQPWERKLFKTGLAMAIPDWYYGRIAPRSGLAYTYGIDILAGVIDASYRGEIGVIVLNTGSESFEVESGMRIAQLIIETCHSVIFEEVLHLDQTKRGEEGFWSTGF